MTMTKADLLALIQSLPADAQLRVEATRGTHEEFPEDTVRTWSLNGTMTLTVHVNGGAQDTRTGLMAMMANLRP